MKTFKIVNLQIAREGEIQDIPLADGLIINKENDDGTWIIEAFIEKQYQQIFQRKYDNEEMFDIRVIITHPANDPAPFTVRIISIQDFEKNSSILFEGQLSRKRNEYPELLLGDLLKEGYSGEQLLAEFKERMKAKQKKKK